MAGYHTSLDTDCSMVDPTQHQLVNPLNPGGPVPGLQTCQKFRLSTACQHLVSQHRHLEESSCNIQCSNSLPCIFHRVVKLCRVQSQPPLILAASNKDPLFTAKGTNLRHPWPYRLTDILAFSTQDKESLAPINLVSNASTRFETCSKVSPPTPPPIE